MIDQEQQRDHTDEAATRAELEREGRAELLAEQAGAVRVFVDPHADALGGVNVIRQQRAEHVALARKATAVGLVVTQLMPMRGWQDCYAVQLWRADGTLWAEGTNESADSIGRHIAGYVSEQNDEARDAEGRAEYAHEQPDDRAEYDDPPAVGTNCC